MGVLIRINNNYWQRFFCNIIACLAGGIVCMKFEPQSLKGNSQEGNGEQVVMASATDDGFAAKTLHLHTIPPATKASNISQR